MNIRYTAMMLSVGLITSANSCEPRLVSNAHFELWCGDTPCGWTVDDGEIQRVPTWHEQDFGARMVGPRVTLSQVSNKRVECFSVDAMAHVADDADLVFEVDFLADGTVEHRQPIGSDTWAPTVFKLKPPSWYDRVRFSVIKHGEGEVVLARLSVVGGGQCTADPIPLLDRPYGADCDDSAQCGAGVCSNDYRVAATDDGETCSACAADADCGAQVCGVVVDGGHAPHRACVDVRSKTFAQRCAGDAECADGVCCDGVCSECCGMAGCGVNQACGRRSFAELGKEADLDLFRVMPFQCAPGEGEAAAGARCMHDEDCASGGCGGSGELTQCLWDGRPCTAEEQCVFGCVALGTAGGTCR